MIAMVDSPSQIVELKKSILWSIEKDRFVQQSNIPQIKYVTVCGREALRIHPMAPFNVPHVAMVDAIVGNYFISKVNYIDIDLISAPYEIVKYCLRLTDSPIYHM